MVILEIEHDNPDNYAEKGMIRLIADQISRLVSDEKALPKWRHQIMGITRLYSLRCENP